MKQKKLLYFLLLSFFFLVLVSADKKEKKGLFSYNSFKKLDGIKLSHNPGIYSKPIELNIKVEKDKKITIETISDSITTISGTKFHINKPTVVKISSISKEGKKHSFIGTYIVGIKHDLPIVSLVVDHNDFFPPNGIYVGKKEKKSGPNSKSITTGRAWDKKPITGFAQFFFLNDLKEELELDVKTYGGMTLGWKEKSLQLSAQKNIHGKGKIKLKLFENLPQREFQHVVLRTSGNDQNKTRIKDLSISHVAEDLHLNTKASRQVVLYINGKYWGIFNLREKVNVDYFKERYNWKKKNIIEVQGYGLKNPDYKVLFDYVAQHNTDKDFYQRISDSIDIENFFSYHIFETYITNVDYRGNTRFFKEKKGKWKWLVYDSDLGCKMDFFNRNFLRDRIYAPQEYWYNPPVSVSLLKNILKNERYKKQFITHYCYLISNYLKPINFINKIDKNARKIESELPRHFLRRDHLYSEDMDKWKSNVKNLKTYFIKRPLSAFQNIKETFGLSNHYPLIISQNHKTFKGLTINNSIIKSNTIEGDFFKEIPFKLSAENTDHQFKFSKWSDGNTQSNREITIDKKTNLQAIYKKLPKSKIISELKIEKFYANFSWDNSLLALTLTNKNSVEINLDKLILYEDESASKISLKGLKIRAHETIIFTNNSNLLKKSIPKIKNRLVPYLTDKAFLQKVKFVLIENNNAIIDDFNYNFSDKQIIEQPGYLITKKQNKYKAKNIKINKINKKTFNSNEMKKEVNKIYMILGLLLFSIVIIYLIKLFFYKK